VGFKWLVDPFLDLPGHERRCLRRQHAKRIDEGERVHMAVARYHLDQVQERGDVGAGGVDREERDEQAIFMSESSRLYRQLHSPLEFPSIRVLDDVLAGWDLHDDGLDASIESPFHVVDHAARESKDARRKTGGGDSPDRLRVGCRNRRQPCFDALDASLGELDGDSEFSSGVNSTPACCSPSRSVTSWISNALGGENSAVTSGW